MKRKRHGTDDVIRKLREAEALEASGQTAAAICQRLEVSEATLARWRKQFRGMGDEDSSGCGRWRRRTGG